MICPTNRGRVREVNDKKPFVGRIIQANGKWGTDNSLNLTTFAGYGPKAAQSPVVCPTNCGRIIEVNDIGEKCDNFDKKRKKICENFDEIIDLKTRKTQYAKNGK